MGMGKNLGDFAAATAELGEQVPILVNGQPVQNIFKSRTAEGDLQVHLHVDGLLPGQIKEGTGEPSEPTAGTTSPDSETPGRRLNDPAELTEEEREALRQTEKLAGVPERRADPDEVDASAPAAGAGEPVQPDLGDQGSESDPL